MKEKFIETAADAIEKAASEIGPNLVQPAGEFLKNNVIEPAGEFIKENGEDILDGIIEFGKGLFGG